MQLECARNILIQMNTTRSSNGAVLTMQRNFCSPRSAFPAELRQCHVKRPECRQATSLPLAQHQLTVAQPLGSLLLAAACWQPTVH